MKKFIIIALSILMAVSCIDYTAAPDIVDEEVMTEELGDFISFDGITISLSEGNYEIETEADGGEISVSAMHFLSKNTINGKTVTTYDKGCDFYFVYNLTTTNERTDINKAEECEVEVYSSAALVVTEEISGAYQSTLSEFQPTGKEVAGYLYFDNEECVSAYFKNNGEINPEEIEEVPDSVTSGWYEITEISRYKLVARGEIKTENGREIKFRFTIYNE